MRSGIDWMGKANLNWGNAPRVYGLVGQPQKLQAAEDKTQSASQPHPGPAIEHPPVYQQDEDSEGGGEAQVGHVRAQAQAIRQGEGAEQGSLGQSGGWLFDRPRPQQQEPHGQCDHEHVGRVHFGNDRLRPEGQGKGEEQRGEGRGQTATLGEQDHDRVQQGHSSRPHHR